MLKAHPTSTAFYFQVADERDHRVHGRIVVPAAALIELAAAAARAPLAQLEIREPLLLAPAQPRRLQLVVTGRDPGERVKLFALADDHEIHEGRDRLRIREGADAPHEHERIVRPSRAGP